MENILNRVIWPTNAKIASIHISSLREDFCPGVDHILAIHTKFEDCNVRFIPSIKNNKHNYYIYLPHKSDAKLLPRARGLLVKV